MSKVFKMDKAGRDALLQSVASKFATVTGWAIKESDRKENYTFLDPILKMKAYNEGVRFCVQSSAKTVNMCLEVYSRKDDEVKVHAFAAQVKETFADVGEVSGLKMQWKVIYKGGLLRITIPANKTDDEIVGLMVQFIRAVTVPYNTFMADVSPPEASAPKAKKAQVVAAEVPAAAEPVAEAAPAVEDVIDEIDVAPVVEEDLA